MTTQGPKYHNTENDEISLKELILKLKEWWLYLLSKWIIILAVGLLGGALGFWYAIIKKPLYTATTTFVLEDEKSGGGLGNLAGLASMAGVDLVGGGGIFQGDNIFELYKSRKMITQTLLSPTVIGGKSDLLINQYIKINKLRSEWEKKPGLKNLKFTQQPRLEINKVSISDRLRDSIIANIVADITKNYLRVSKLDKKLSIVKVDVNSSDEIFAKVFNEAIVKTVNDFYVQTKTKKSLQNVVIIQRKTDSVRNVINGAIYTAAAVADATPNLNPTRQIQRLAPSQRAQFSAETNKAILGSLVQNLEMSKLALMQETPLLEVIDQPVYPLNKKVFGKITGFILGGIIFSFFGVLFFTVKRVYYSLMV